jgi:aryl-alcohol dehydrogenase-like predicted oxidoreductase
MIYVKQRRFGKTNKMVSEISLGTWQLGSKWGDPFDPEVALNTLKGATEVGINCYDTADVYQGGASEVAIGEYIKTLDQQPFVITKVGRYLDPHVASGYNEQNIRGYIEESIKRMNVDSLDMVLLHCPPTDVYYNPDVFSFMDKFKEEGLIKHYGVSIEKIEEGLKAMQFPGVEAIEVIFNMFRLRPLETLFEEAKKNDVAIIVRVPLASGLLSGKYTIDTTFKAGDHRTFNRNGEAFDKGETFSGVEYNKGLEAVEELKTLFPNQNLAQVALRWILMFDAVSTVIPGASKPEHIISNAKASELEPLTQEQMKGVEDIYNKFIKHPVHFLW